MRSETLAEVREWLERVAEDLREAEHDLAAEPPLVRGAVFRPLQARFLAIPQAPLCYWLREQFFYLLAGQRLGDIAKIVQQIITANNNRFLRFCWEIRESSQGWSGYLKAGGYSRWFGFDNTSLDWRDDGIKLKTMITEKYSYLNGNWGWLVKEGTFFKPGWTYTLMAQGCLGVRTLDAGYICDSVSPTIVLTQPLAGLGAILNCRISSYLLRALSASLKFRESYVASVPLPDCIPHTLPALESTCIVIKCWLVAREHTERTFSESVSEGCGLVEMCHTAILSTNTVAAMLHTLEGLSERLVFDAYRLDASDIAAVLDETGTPAGWFLLIKDYDRLPVLPAGLPEPPCEMLEYFERHERCTRSSQQLQDLKCRLRSLYEAGPGAQEASNEAEDTVAESDEEEEVVVGAHIPIPTETFLEELSQKLEIHPISVYWLLKEGIEQEGWRCLSEERRITTDRFTVIILRLLGHRWPKQIEAGEPVPDWADADGIIPLTEGTGELTLLDRVRERIVVEFEGGDIAAIEREFAEIMGKPLDQWLTTEFFKHHTRQFKKRPIAWQIQSGKFTARKKPAFACLVYYHKLDSTTLTTIQSQYVRPLRQRYETELRGIEAIPVASRSDRQEMRRVELETLIHELHTFDDALEEVAAKGFSSTALANIVNNEPLDEGCSLDGIKPYPDSCEALLRQEMAYIPDINDGVRVNIAPLQKAGLLAADVLASKDVDKAIADRAEWRADERRWCREGKLPRPGWWTKEEEKRAERHVGMR